MSADAHHITLRQMEVMTALSMQKQLMMRETKS